MMKGMGNILLTLSLLFCLSCGETKEYPWNDAWNETEQEAPETPENPETPDITSLYLYHTEQKHLIDAFKS